MDSDMTEKMSETIGIAVIGSGYWGKNLIRNYDQLGVLRLICDKNETLLGQFKQQYTGVDICVALNDVLARDNIQGVVISTPAETHFHIAREALLAGKHVFVEKPLVLYEHEADELIKLSQQTQTTLMVGHLMQYHPVFICLKSMASRGDLGRINYIYSNRLNLGKIRREENILWSFAPHDISMILALAGEDPETVQAMAGNYLHQKIADVTTTHLEFPSGLKAHIFVSWLHPFKEQKLVVVGDRKMAVFDDTRPWPDKLLLYPHQINWQNHMPVPTKADPERVDIAESEPLAAECRHFLGCIQKGHKPLTDGQEGLTVLKILRRSQRSIDANGIKIRLTQRPDGYATSSAIPHEKLSIISGHDAEGSPQVHATAVIDDHVTIGHGTKIWHFSHILPQTIIGDHCNIGQNVVVGPFVKVGNQCKIQNNVSVYKGVTLEDGVFCGPSMVFTNVFNPRAEIKKMDQVRPTLVKKGATIGANATILCGVTLGRFAFVGAGAVVTKNVPDYGLVVGNPANRIGWVCRCGERLPEDLYCTICDIHYVLADTGLKEIRQTG
jgi:predicted dehydrogenase/acetyltransferase-like isoleucine patch superfamily enzyme